MRQGRATAGSLQRAPDADARKTRIDQQRGRHIAGDVVRPLTDQVRVRAAAIIPYRLEARLTLYDGAEAQAVRAQAVAAVQGFVSDHHRLGHDITLSGLHAALHGRGVQNVRLTRPATDIVVGPAEAAYCTAITVTVGGHNV